MPESNELCNPRAFFFVIFRGVPDLCETGLRFGRIREKKRKVFQSMLALRDNLVQCFGALRAHKLRTSLTMLGLTMGVATLITVMTIVQGANLFVEKKIANLGTNVFQIARTPFAVTDFNIIIKALKYKKIEMEDMRAIAEGCPACEEVGATASTTVRARYGNKEEPDVSFSGQTAH